MGWFRKAAGGATRRTSGPDLPGTTTGEDRHGTGPAIMSSSRLAACERSWVLVTYGPPEFYDIDQLRLLTPLLRNQRKRPAIAMPR